MTPLAEALACRIARDGPIPIDAYMSAALLDPDHGYYTTHDPFGGAGDFITAPEISQMFGELIGLWLYATWQQAGAPPAPLLTELGPGRGTLMADALRAIGQASGGHQPFRLHLVEASRCLAAHQRQALDGHDVTWHTTLDDLPADGPFYAVANEFLDALPVRQFVATPRGWRERLLDWQGGRLVPVPAATTDASDPLVARLPGSVPTGRIAELGPAREACAGALARRIATSGGAALLIDFSAPGLPLADTLQAVRGHRYADRFAEPGGCDLAAAVDFGALAGAVEAAGARAVGPVAQGAFLRALGIDARAAILQRNAGPAQARAIAAARNRLVAADGMGEDFRVLAIVPAEAPAPEGLAPPEP